MDFSDYSSYKDFYVELVQLERREEMERHRREIREMHPRERQSKGRALINMKGKDKGRGVGQKYQVKYLGSRGGELPDNEISVGDLVMVSRNEPLNPDNPTGTVIEKTNYSITIEYTNKPPGFAFGKGVRVDLYVNDITYQRMLDALKKWSQPNTSKTLRDIIVGIKEPREPETTRIDLNNKNLNKSQKKAVQLALNAEHLFLIHGPPGTGKTTALVEAIEQHIDQGDRVLATASSNTAVDNMVEMLNKQGRHVVRVGHPARVTETLKQHTLDHILQNVEAYKEGQSARQKAYRLLDEQEKHTYPSGRWRRGLSNKAIQDLAKKGEGARGIPPKKIESMAKWIELKKEIDQLMDKAKELEDQAIREVLETADVVCTTNSTAGSNLLTEMEFDTLFIDEATQATEPSCLIPTTKTRKIVMAGDHKQLPPTILNQKAKQKGLEQTMFERLAQKHSQNIHTLKKQYRMNKEIMKYPNQEFYNNKLQPANQVKNHTLTDLTNKQTTLTKEPLTFIDNKTPERKPEGSNSRTNPGEAEITIKITKKLLNQGLKPSQIGIISPYKAQTEKIKEKLPNKKIETKTVDGFQGREKETIIVSLVRSNKQNQIGFLKNQRRLNVTITRAKRKLILIGNPNTLKTNPTYKKLINHIKQNGQYLKTQQQTT
ncbi:IGHMBP2 family helicase [Methanonatronarchaeum sp. AMET-Sl]|uniref:IGHMBP2 family helicase n=1 Tax=Methanonatronarchaeum sp. AMET-Sl TaxID=3037654 RepID=UPI00244DEEDF|nr:IGHMBP2 family helicase [Methanonatronarchaeum sp. AMET-Sl]WGI17614.1 IGHMBP2 family helicase [Methanonatronarchaeum sp. AMET-Sl]